MKSIYSFLLFLSSSLGLSAQDNCQGSVDLIPTNYVVPGNPTGPTVNQTLLAFNSGTTVIAAASTIVPSTQNRGWTGEGAGIVRFEGNRCYFQEDGSNVASLSHPVGAFTSSQRAGIVVDFFAQNVTASPGGRPMQMEVLYKNVVYATATTKDGNTDNILDLTYSNGASSKRSSSYDRAAWQIVLPLGITGGGDVKIRLTPLAGTGTLVDDFLVYSVKFQVCSAFLPVVFDNLQATIKNDELLVNWSTISETQNDHFIVTASLDGQQFKEIGQVKSMAPNGHSTSPLHYSFSRNNIFGLALLGSFSLLALAGLTFKSQRKRGILLALMGLVALGYGCIKGSGPKLDPQQKEVFIRLIQVNQDGSKNQSGIIRAVKE